jgi:hypothetical protein
VDCRESYSATYPIGFVINNVPHGELVEPRTNPPAAQFPSGPSRRMAVPCGESTGTKTRRDDRWATGNP